MKQQAAGRGLLGGGNLARHLWEDHLPKHREVPLEHRDNGRQHRVREHRTGVETDPASGRCREEREGEKGLRLQGRPLSPPGTSQVPGRWPQTRSEQKSRALLTYIPHLGPSQGPERGPAYESGSTRLRTLDSAFWVLMHPSREKTTSSPKMLLHPHLPPASSFPQESDWLGTKPAWPSCLYSTTPALSARASHQEQMEGGVSGVCSVPLALEACCCL